jgi:APA family basic amino acid/polyamine antiporter
MNDRPLGIRTLFAVVYTTSVSSVYFALGVIASHANGLTPLVLLAAGFFFVLTAMSYGEGGALHQERGGSAVFARYAFNELVSFVAGWAIVLDYTILVAVTALTVPAYLAVFWAPIGRGGLDLAIAIAVIAVVSIDNLTGITAVRLRRRLMTISADLALQGAVIVLGLILVFHPSRLTAAIHLGSAPKLTDLAFAMPIAAIAFTGLEAAASLAGEVSATGSDLKRLIGPGALVIVLVYVGTAVIGISALQVHHGVTALGREHLRAPLLGIVEAYHPHWLATAMKYVVAVAGALALVGAAGASMLGVTRTGYSLATNRQVPSALGRLHTKFGTPFVMIGSAAVAAIALALPKDPSLLIGIYAFGAMVAFTIAHMSVLSMRRREPARERLYEVPFSLRVRGVRLPLPSVLGAFLGFFGWCFVVIFHQGARYVGGGWVIGGLVLYTAYRKTQGKPIFKRVTIPDRALRHEGLEPEFGSILVPIFGHPLDDDIVQTAGRLAGSVHDDLGSSGAMIEAIWVLEVPMALPLDASLPEQQVKRAREALARAKVVGEEYEGVSVATALVRARRVGQGIVNEARRRGVDSIVLAAEEPSRVKGGARLGGGAGPLDNYIGEVTKYVVRKAPCRVILTAPPAAADDAAVAAGGRRDGGFDADADPPLPTAAG